MEYLALTFPGGVVTPPSVIKEGGITYLSTLLSRALTIFLVVGLIFIAVYLVWGGLQWITSQGDKAKLTAARGRITWAIIGFIVLLLAVFIVNAVGYIFKVNVLQLKP